MDRPFAAHILEDRSQIQTILEHAEGTANLAQRFAAQFDSGPYGALCGMLHDIGKYSKRFQTRIYEGGHPVDHSTAGAVELHRALPHLGDALAYCIAGHHGGLPDGGTPADEAEPTLYGRLNRKLEPYEQFAQDIHVGALLPKEFPLLEPLGTGGFTQSFWIRMLFSALVDADFLDTEAFMQAGKANRPQGQSIEELNNLLTNELQKYADPQTDLNRKRTEILNRCEQQANLPRGLYTLTVPTGGGKTLSSLSFALRHAKEHGLRRVIYVIPYTSIIEQNAAVFQRILGEDNVLEHHSNFDFEDTPENPSPFRRAAENWDMPVVVTTMVQFFESLFASRGSRCRKLHNIANSVIIFDEAQMLPLPFLNPCVWAIAELVRNYRCTAVLCSATQPALAPLFPKGMAARELCENTDELYRFFRRTRFEQLGKLEDNELAGLLGGHMQALCIVSTRKQAQALFQMLPMEGSFHLSTLMYPKHRKAVLEQIRWRLKNDLPCRVVSTSLIEAGVDVDFPVVYRAQAGLDSMIQAAGRCNREGGHPTATVYIFTPAGGYRLPDLMKLPAKLAQMVIEQFEDCGDPEAIHEYFSLLYKNTGEGLDAAGILPVLERRQKRLCSFPFRDIEKKFQLIEQNTCPVFIPLEPAAQVLLEQLEHEGPDRFLLRKMQQYTVNLYQNEVNNLYGAGIIRPVTDSELWILVNAETYCETTGLNCIADTGKGVFV